MVLNTNHYGPVPPNWHRASIETELELPFFVSSIPAGFPSPADDYIDLKLDLNKLVVANPMATYYVRVSGDSMIDDDIHDGNILVVDRSLTAQPGDVVICCVDGEFTVKRWQRAGRMIVLLPSNPDYEPQYVHPGQKFEIWGVVTFSIRNLRRRGNG
ncbi:LexA family protein [Rudanella lutea]|uniref:LexA family protein n=1 Tax=Rudanella lutea TaxID=451374 RepID=UPI00037BECDB|nr:translesion error-prone DNA polymerase V autoproteolytic subunit [Rudanella lutea]